MSLNLNFCYVVIKAYCDQPTKPRFQLTSPRCDMAAIHQNLADTETFEETDATNRATERREWDILSFHYGGQVEIYGWCRSRNEAETAIGKRVAAETTDAAEVQNKISKIGPDTQLDMCHYTTRTTQGFLQWNWWDVREVDLAAVKKD